MKQLVILIYDGLLYVGFLFALSCQKLGVFMETQIHDDVLLAPSIMINIGTNVGPVMTNTASVFTHVRAHIIQTTFNSSVPRAMYKSGAAPMGFWLFPNAC